MSTRGIGARAPLARYCAAALLILACAAGVRAQPAAPLTAEEIVARNAEARGGVEAWRKVQTMAWAGRAEIGSTPGRTLPFLLEQKRPDKTRFEIIAEGSRSVRMFDGQEGWKLRQDPAGGRPKTDAYTKEELDFARGAPVIDGPLMDYAAHHALITLAGHGPVDGRDAYVLDVKLPSGGGQRIWVDRDSFLEVRQDRMVRDAAGKPGVVTMLLREYRDFEGLKIPTSVETSAEPGRPANRLIVERVAINPELQDLQFSRPQIRQLSGRKGIVVDTRSAAVRPPEQTASPR